MQHSNAMEPLTDMMPMFWLDSELNGLVLLSLLSHFRSYLAGHDTSPKATPRDGPALQVAGPPRHG